MTKAELEQENKELKEELEELQSQYNYLDEAYGELENTNAELVNNLGAYYISDVDYFILRLKIENLYTPEFEKFMEEYMQYYNDLNLG